ncbi:MAG: hypothetical protein LBC79_08500 [Deltaproteobacteria bacterium]|nr:hypothetical protein [Deltaproteobacteria bacterium]
MPAPAIKQEAALRCTQAPPECGILAKALEAQRRIDPVGHEQHRNKIDQAKLELQQGTAFTPKAKDADLMQKIYRRVTGARNTF